MLWEIYQEAAAAAAAVLGGGRVAEVRTNSFDQRVVKGSP